jgi:hypothetical protein
MVRLRKEVKGILIITFPEGALGKRERGKARWAPEAGRDPRGN